MAEAIYTAGTQYIVFTVIVLFALLALGTVGTSGGR